MTSHIQNVIYKPLRFYHVFNEVKIALLKLYFTIMQKMKKHWN